MSRSPAQSKRIPLRRLLLLSHLGLTIGLVSVALAAATWLLRAAILQQSEARVEQGAVEGLRRIEDGRRELSVVAKLLGERPTLIGFLKNNQNRQAEAFLDTYRHSAMLDSIRITRGDQLVLEVGETPFVQGRSGLQFTGTHDSAWRVEKRTISALPELSLWLIQRLPSALLEGAPGETLHTELLPAAALQGGLPDGDRRRTALRHVLATGKRELISDLPDMAVLRIEPMRAPDGALIALLSVGMPKAIVEREMLRWMLILLVGTGALAIAGLWMARRLARRISMPFADLASASQRLGLGDLQTALPVLQRPMAEADVLARSLESMRVRLLESSQRERHQRRELDAVLDGVADGIVSVDAERNIVYANQRFMEMFGEVVVVGRFCGDILQPEPVDGRRPCDGRCPLLVARETERAHAIERCTVQGRVRNLAIISTASPGERQVAIIREETPVEASRAMRDAILANLSHEFQTPLAAQIAAIELLRDHLQDGDDLVSRKLVDSQYRGALRLSQLVDNLLDSVRLDSGEMRLRRDDVDLVGVIEDAVELMQPLLDQRGQKVEVNLVRSTGVVRGDRQRLTQVMVNLLANANKFAPDQSTIWVETNRENGQAGIWVEDEGPGFPELIRHGDLFSPFRRAPEEEPSQRGSGLGLAIVRALVERHGGSVIIAIPQHRQGARIGVVLPLEES